LPLDSNPRKRVPFESGSAEPAESPHSGRRRVDDISPKFATIRVFAALSGISRRNCYIHLAAGNLRGHLVGSRTLVDVEHGLARIASQPPPLVTRFEDDRHAPVEGAQRAGVAERAHSDRPGLAA
jgi:hypothetical protein